MTYTKCAEERRDIAARGKTYTTIDQIAGPIAGVSRLAAIHRVRGQRPCA